MEGSLNVYIYRSHTERTGIPDIKCTKYNQNIFIFVKMDLRPKTIRSMSHHCPLCGKEKCKESLFCDSCAKKIRTEYELDLPQQVQLTPLLSTDKLSDTRLDALTGADLEQKQNEEADEVNADSSVENQNGIRQNADHDESVVEGNSNRKTLRRIRRIAILLLLLIVAFFLYNELIRKGNLERSSWDAAIKTNSVTGYLQYIEKFPDGLHFADAQVALMQLKADEAEQWEWLKKSDRVTELRDFLEQNPESNYTPLVKRRLDSLTWMGALHSNTVAAYYDYMLMAESGGFNGDYLAEAETRYRQLFQTYPVDQNTLDSIRSVVNGFSSALSSLDHAKLESLLAPRLQRYYFRGPLVRERLLGELLIDAARSTEPPIAYVPDLEGVQYEKTLEENYRVNVPLLKSFTGEGIEEQIPGYILHLEMNPSFQISTVHETKPYPGAP